MDASLLEFYKKTKPLLLGHRGARRAAPENTLSSFAQCLEHGCDGFEFDVRLTGDGQAVVCHDARVFGMEVARRTYAEIKERADRRGRTGELGIPLLEEVLEGFAASAFLDVELKVPGAEKLTLELLGRYPPRRGYMISSFLPGALANVRALKRDAVLGFISDRARHLARWRELDVEAVMAERKLLTPKLMEELREAGKQVFVWTVNRASQMERFAALGVTGIISDNTALLHRTFAR
jgi:glycerophosphoryl diester phosphodiesterase